MVVTGEGQSEPLPGTVYFLWVTHLKQDFCLAFLHLPALSFPLCTHFLSSSRGLHGLPALSPPAQSLLSLWSMLVQRLTCFPSVPLGWTLNPGSLVFPAASPGVLCHSTWLCASCGQKSWFSFFLHLLSVGHGASNKYYSWLIRDWLACPCEALLKCQAQILAW